MFFCELEVTFLSFILFVSGLKLDPTNIKFIIDWPTPKSFMDVRSFHGLFIFYKRFIKNFSTIMAHITDILRKDKFAYTIDVGKAIEQTKIFMATLYVLKLSNFNKIFELTCYALDERIGGVLI